MFSGDMEMKHPLKWINSMKANNKSKMMLSAHGVSHNQQNISLVINKKDKFH